MAISNKLTVVFTFFYLGVLIYLLLFLTVPPIQNAIIQSGLHGIKISGATMYCTHTPCRMCAKEIVNAGIKKVISYQDFSGDKGAKEFLQNSGVIIKICPRFLGSQKAQKLYISPLARRFFRMIEILIEFMISLIEQGEFGGVFKGYETRRVE